MLLFGKKIFYTATDDNHNANPFVSKKCDFFGGFTMIKTPQLEYTAITEALLKGDFTLRNALKFASFAMRITKFT